MIQFKRGSSDNWGKIKTPLADGQPGYDKDRHKLKIGDGKSDWDKLPYASGMSADEILSSETDAKNRVVKVLGLALTGIVGMAYSAMLSILKLDDRPIFTYGTDTPDENTIGRVYLQYYDAEPEVDYVVDYGVDGIWTYRKWHSGIAECFGTVEVSTTVQTAAGSLYSDDKAMEDTSYPVTFISRPHEVASLQSPGGLVWLAGRSENTTTNTALYTLFSTDSQTSQATYKIGLSVTGRWK